MTKASGEPVVDEERLATFDRQQKVMSMFSDNAKTYIQLSSAALALTVTFAHEILNIPRGQSIVNLWMVLMWGCFLLTVIAGAFYQYLAAKYVEACLDWDHYRAWGWLQPGNVYGVMLASFYGGAVLFTVYAVVRLGHANGAS